MSLEAWGDEGNDTYGPDEIEEILAEVHEELEAVATSARIHEIAAKHHFDIVTEETAQETRRHLEKASTR